MTDDPPEAITSPNRIPDGRLVGTLDGTIPPSASSSSTPATVAPFPLVPNDSTTLWFVADQHSNQHDLDELHLTVSHRLRAVGLRYTRSRRQVVDVLASTDRPLTIPDILAQADQLAQSSAYRNLTELIDAGVVYRIVAGDEFSHFELAEDLTHHHHHLVCTRCGRVDDFVASDELERSLHGALDGAAGAKGFTVQHHRLDLVGTCADCELDSSDRDTT